MGDVTTRFVKVTQPLISMCQAGVNRATLLTGYTELKAAADALSAAMVAKGAPGGGGISEVQILGSLIGVGLSDTGTADATNLLVSTQQAFAGIDWVDTFVTMADVNAIGPDGSLTASTMTEVTGGTPRHNITQGFNATASAQYSYSKSLKQGLRTRGVLVIIDTSPTGAANYALATFDLAGGAIGIAAAANGTFSGASATITAKSNGFYLCTITSTVSSSGTYGVQCFADAGSGSGVQNLNYAGNNSAPALTIDFAKVNAGAASAYTALNSNIGVAASTIQQVFSPNGGTTAYWGTQTANAYVAFDAGVPVVYTRYRFVPSPSFSSKIGQWPYTPDYAQLINGAQVQTSVADSTFASPTTVDTLPAVNVLPYYPRYVLSERTLSAPTPSRYIRWLPPSVSFGGLSEWQVFAKQGTTANACPVQPVISPMGGKFPSLSTPVTMMSTQGAKIYYNVGIGSPPADPTTASTLYTGAFTQAIGAGTAVYIKAIANLPSLSTPNSLVTTSAPFYGYGFAPNADEFDTSGILIEAHSGCVMYDPNSAAYYRVGQFMNINTVIHASTTPEPNYGATVFLYKSTDLMNWTNLGSILNDPFPNQPIAGNYNLLYNVANNNYVIWTSVIDDSGNSSLYYAITSGSNIASGWSWNLTPIVANTFFNFATMIDSDGATAYVVWRHDLTNTYIQQLNSTYTGLTGSPLIQTSAALREGFAFFKYPNSVGGTYFLITGAANPYDSSANMDLRYTFNTGSTPLVNTWNAVPSSGASAWSSSPTGTNYNGQMFGSFLPQGKTQPFAIMDYWVRPLYGSRQVWLPLAMTSNTLQIQRPANWNPAALTPSAGSISGSVTTFTSTQNINLTSLAGSGDWAAYGYNVNNASVWRKAGGGSLFSAITQIGSVTVSQTNNSGARHWSSTWTDGTTPNTSVSNEAYVVYVTDTSGHSGDGFSFTVPAGTSTKTLDIYVSVSNNTSSVTTGQLTATLSDSSALPYIDTSVGTINTDTDSKLGHYTITYNAASAGQFLTVAWINNTTDGQNVQLYAATLM